MVNSQRILLKAGKNPFIITSAEETVAKNYIGANVGNYMFAHSTYRFLSPNNHLTTAYYDLLKMDPTYIDTNYDVLVLPMANAFSKAFINDLIPLTDLINKLSIPVVVIGVGLQADIGMSNKDLKAFDNIVKNFANAVLKKSDSIGVRGFRTADYLNSLGVKNVTVIGCPSMYMCDESFKIQKNKETLDANSKVSFTVTPRNQNIVQTMQHNYQKYKQSTYIPQDIETLKMMMDIDTEGTSFKKGIPSSPDHYIFKKDKARFFLDVSTWTQFLATQDFMYGDRIHGALASIVSGTPSYILAHDSRTLEMAEYLDIPHSILKGPNDIRDASQLYAEADYTKFNKNHSIRFRSFVEFLDRNRLNHSLEKPDLLKEYDEKLKSITFPAPVKPFNATTRIEKLREALLKSKQMLRRK